eukprot:5015218-Pyramimonas_sp.AAC.1
MPRLPDHLAVGLALGGACRLGQQVICSVQECAHRFVRGPDLVAVGAPLGIIASLRFGIETQHQLLH